MIPNKIEDEIAFLKNFGKRFKRKETYHAAINDLYAQGLITKQARDAVVKGKKSKTKVNKPSKKNNPIIVGSCDKIDRCDPCHVPKRSSCDTPSSSC